MGCSLLLTLRLWRAQINFSLAHRFFRQPRVAPPEVLRRGLPPLEPMTPAQAKATQAVAAALGQTYDLQTPWPLSPHDRVAGESLTVLAHCDAVLRPYLSQQAAWQVLDVGSKQATYLPGLVAFMRQYLNASGQLSVQACELDGGRRYADGWRRADYAEGLLALTRQWARDQGLSDDRCQLSYRIGDVQRVQGQFDVITWFMPFVFLSPHAAWGLPRRYFKPQALTDHVLSLLKPQGYLLLIHLNAEEATAQQQRLAASAWAHEIVSTGTLVDHWMLREEQRCFCLVRRLKDSVPPYQPEPPALR